MGFSRYKLIGVIATNMNTNTVNVRSIPPYPSLVFTMLQNIERGEKLFYQREKFTENFIFLNWQHCYSLQNLYGHL